MTKRKPEEELQRPRRPLGEQLMFYLACPWEYCRSGVRVVAYRRRTVRLECRECGQRFSVSGDDVVDRINALIDIAEQEGEKELG